jgi:hypothetical protein
VLGLPERFVGSPLGSAHIINQHPHPRGITFFSWRGPACLGGNNPLGTVYSYFNWGLYLFYTEVTLVVEDEVSNVASLVEECYRAWRRAGELLDKLEEIAVRNCLDRYRPGHPDLSWFYDDQFEPLWRLEDEGYVRFRWAGRELYLEARIHRDGRVECIAGEHTIR